MKHKPFAISVVFLAIIFFPLVGELAGFNASKSLDSENVNASSNVSFKQRISGYVRNYEKGFMGRELLVKAFIDFKRNLLHISPLPEKVILGKEGWLFLADYGTMDDCRNLYPFSESQIDSINTHLTAVASKLRDRGIRFYVVVVPDKHTIYPEYLPNSVTKVNQHSRLQQVSDYYRRGDDGLVSFIDLTDTLMMAKKLGRVYYTEESHWNDFGAFVGYSKILKRIASDFPSVAVLDSASCTFFAGEENDIDLAKLLGKGIEYTEKTLKVVPRVRSHIIFDDHFYEVPADKVANPFFAFKRSNLSLSGLQLIVFRDSFFSALVPFFENTFASSTFIWTSQPHLEYILEQGPDIVILEVAERNLHLLTK